MISARSPTGQIRRLPCPLRCRTIPLTRPHPNSATPGVSPMKYGMNLLLWTGHVGAEHFPLLAQLKKTGFDGVELPLFGGDAAHYQTVRKELDNNGLGCTAVTVVNAHNNPISP